MPLIIPQDQLDKIVPIVEDLRAGFARIVEDLPLQTESALRFHPDGECQP